MRLQDALEQFILDGEARALSSSTIRWYHARVSRLIRSLEERGVSEVEQVVTADLRSFMTNLRNQDTRWLDHPYHPPSEGRLSPHTIHGYVRAIRAFFNWLVDEEVIRVNPARHLRLPSLPKQPPKAISTKDRDRLLEAAKPDSRDYAIVCFLADTGCRVGGLVGLQLSDLDLETGRAVVQEKGKGGGKSRTVYFNGRTKEALSRWLEARPASEDNAVFLSKQTGEALTTSGIYQVLKRLAKRVGIGGRFNPHAFRHGWAREALKNGGTIADVAQVLGHEDEVITIRFYGRWADDELKKRHSKISPLAGD